MRANRGQAPLLQGRRVMVYIRERLCALRSIRAA
ncbi:hypothetical protein PKB_0665 [Pseudomonas knackmussii B13]|uniref:Uncharacterized protein n=1 Tax=Pseudomonas knackmussii (strain DSM 6978 / CCUG 54928 / LMG 23759 / B13) TaxID=1301098 RepID=A0A024HC18_PSEKB|nr:hypothetical protein PKB_0665 [Pseudomonas knackmussii B13]